MPIIGMTDNLRPGFPELGRLRKGAKKTQANKPGEDLDHFRFTSERSEVVEAFRAIYKDEPRMVNCFLPYAKAEAQFDGDVANFSAWMELWNGSGTLLHRCDGKHVVRWFDKTGGGKYVTEKGKDLLCPWQSGEKERTKKDPGCKQVGRLSILIPELLEAGFVGYVLVETHSKNDIISLLASLLKTEDRCQQYGGDMTGVLCRLQRIEETITTPGWSEADRTAGKRRKTKKSLLKLMPAPEWMRAIQIESRKRAMLELPAPTSKGLALLEAGEEGLPAGEVVDGSAVRVVDNETGEILTGVAKIEAELDELGIGTPAAPAGAVDGASVEPELSDLDKAMRFETKTSGRLGRVDPEVLSRQLDFLVDKQEKGPLTEYETELRRHIEIIQSFLQEMEADEGADWLNTQHARLDEAEIVETQAILVEVSASTLL